MAGHEGKVGTRARLAQLAGGSMLAVMASAFLAPPAFADCQATANTTEVSPGVFETNSVAVNCDSEPGDATSLFDTTHEGATSGTVTYSDYDGSGDDVVEINDVVIQNSEEAFPPPIVNINEDIDAGLTLDGPTRILDTFGGDDRLELDRGAILGGVNLGSGADEMIVTDGDVGSLAAPVDVNLGAGNDIFEISHTDDPDLPLGFIYGRVLGGTGADQITVNGSHVTAGIDAGAGADTVNVLGGTVGSADAPANVDLGTGDDTFTVSGAFADDGEGGLSLVNGTVHGALLGGDGAEDIDIGVGGIIAGGIDAGTDGDNINVVGGVVGSVDAPADVNLGLGSDVFTVRSGSITSPDGTETVNANGIVHGAVLAGGGRDTISVGPGGTVEGRIDAGGGVDSVSVQGGTVGIAGTPANVDLGTGNDLFVASGAFVDDGEGGLTLADGIVHGAVQGGAGADDIAVGVGGVIEGGIAAGDANDRVSILGGVVGTAAAPANVDLGSGSDAFVIGAGSIGGGPDAVEADGIVHGAVLGGGGRDSIVINAGGVIDFAVDAGGGIDAVTIAGGSVGTFVDLGTGDDSFTLSEGAIGEYVDGGAGNDGITIAGGTVGGSVFGDGAALPQGDDTIAVSGGAIGGSVFAGGGNDRVTISGAARIGVAGGGGDSVGLEDGNDNFIMTGGTLDGAVSAGAGNDVLALSGGEVGAFVGGGAGNDRIDVSGTANILGHVTAEDGEDRVTITGGTVGTFVDLGAGNDVVRVSGTAVIGGAIFGGAGADQVFIAGGEVGDIDSTPNLVSVDTGDGDDAFSMSGGTTNTVNLGLGADGVEIAGGTIRGGVFTDNSGGPQGNDNVLVTGGSIGEGGNFSAVDTGGGDDSIEFRGGRLGGAIFAGAGNDVVTISGAATAIGTALPTNAVAVQLLDGDDELSIAGGVINGSVTADQGDDVVSLSGGSVTGGIDLGTGANSFTMTGGRVGQNVVGGADVDTFALSGGTIGGSVLGAGGADTVTVSGATIEGDVQSATVTLTSGTIEGDIQAGTVELRGGSVGGDITGLSGNTLTIQATNLSLRNGVRFEGTDAVGSITGTALGGTQSQNFSGFASLSLNDTSSVRFAGGDQVIDALSVLTNSTLFVSGQIALNSQAGGGGSLTVTDATINMVNGVATDVLEVGDIALDGATIRIDVNAVDSVSDQIHAGGTFDANGTSLVFVNLLGAPIFTGVQVIPIAPVVGEAVPEGGDASPFFQVEVQPQTPGALLDYQVITGDDGGVYLLVEPTEEASAAVAGPRSEVDSRPNEIVTDTVYDILNDTVITHFNLVVGASRSPAAPNFGVYASGQAARVNHDGFSVSGGGLSGTGPGFTADDFSLAASVEFDAAQYYGLDRTIGLDIGVFGGYASSSLEFDGTSLFPEIGSADNRSFMVGGYGLVRQGTTYGLVSATGFFGNTDITSDVLNSTGEYDTAGVAVTGSIGHVYQLGQNLRFDLRGGLLGVYFEGDSYQDSQGIDYGRSQISFGAIKFEPGIFGQYVLDGGKVFSPYLRLDLQQRFGYQNTSSVEDVDFEFDDADFSAALSGGFNYQMSKTTTISAELRGKASEDSTTVGGKIGLKARF